MKKNSHSKIYYVYTHKLNNQLFYIGSNHKAGSATRWKDVRPSRRPKLWRDYVKNDYQKVQCEIIKYFDTSEEAHRFEINMIKECRRNNIFIAEGEGNNQFTNPSLNYEKSSKEEWKRNISKAVSGDKNPMRTKVMLVTKEGEKIIFESKKSLHEYLVKNYNTKIGYNGLKARTGILKFVKYPELNDLKIITLKEKAGKILY